MTYVVQCMKMVCNRTYYWFMMKQMFDKAIELWAMRPLVHNEAEETQWYIITEANNEMRLTMRQKYNLRIMKYNINQIRGKLIHSLLVFCLFQSEFLCNFLILILSKSMYFTLDVMLLVPTFHNSKAAIN